MFCFNSKPIILFILQQFICDEGSGDHIGRIDEPETCSYVMTVHTNKICHHPYLKPIKQSQAISITCNPILSQEHFTEYQQMIEGLYYGRDILTNFIHTKWY